MAADFSSSFLASFLRPKRRKYSLHHCLDSPSPTDGRQMDGVQGKRTVLRKDSFGRGAEDRLQVTHLSRSQRRHSHLPTPHPWGGFTEQPGRGFELQGYVSKQLFACRYQDPRYAEAKGTSDPQASLLCGAPRSRRRDGSSLDCWTGRCAAAQRVDQEGAGMGGGPRELETSRKARGRR